MYATTFFSALFGACQGFIALFVVRDLVGLGEGLGYSTGQSTIADETAPSRRALYQGIFNAGYGVIGLGLGALIMTQLASAYGWRVVYPILAIFGFAVVTALVFLLPRRPRRLPPHMPHLQRSSRKCERYCARLAFC